MGGRDRLAARRTRVRGGSACRIQTAHPPPQRRPHDPSVPAPLIAITATTEMLGDALRVRVNDAYVRAVARAGGMPLVLPPLEDDALAGRSLDGVQALVLTGGEDVAPARYGAPRHPATERANDRRDAWEVSVARAARARSVPTLAICRGVQVLNVALGGTLVQDLPSEWRGALPHDPEGARDARVHDVGLEPGSRLAATLGTARCEVNSFHHQALDRVAPGIRVAARAPDGVIEGVEADGDWWMLGVQWHPEELVDTPEPWDRRLFEALVAAARSA